MHIAIHVYYFLYTVFRFNIWTLFVWWGFFHQFLAIWISHGSYLCSAQLVSVTIKRDMCVLKHIPNHLFSLVKYKIHAVFVKMYISWFHYSIIPDLGGSDGGPSLLTPDHP